jgi:fibronectin type 3 domain-containing protein
MKIKSIITISVLIMLISISLWPLFEEKGEGKVIDDLPIDIRNTNSKIDILKINSNYFTENKGQWNPELSFIAETSFGYIGIGKDCIYYNVIEIRENNQKHNIKSMDVHSKELFESYFQTQGHIVKLSFLDSNFIEPLGLEPLSHFNNYFYSNNTSKWVKGVMNYEKIIYKNLWNGIDLVYYFNENGLKYEFIISPGVNPERIQICLEGHNLIRLNNFQLIIDLINGLSIEDKDLKIYYFDDSKIEINGNFKLINENTYSFELLNYDSTKKIIIDPLIYSTYIGGIGKDGGVGITLDSDKNSYISGYTVSSDFPTTVGIYDSTLNGNDIFITKINSEGTDLIFSTYIGGKSNESGADIAVDSIGNIYLTGGTRSADFPITNDAFDKNHNGKSDFYLLKLNPKGSEIIYSTLIGGKEEDLGSKIIVDSSGNSYIIGSSWSSDFPTTENAYDKVYSGSYDIVIFKFNSAGSKLLFSTFLGGNYNDWAHGFTIDQYENVYLTGSAPKDFPITNNVYDISHNGGYYDAYVAKLNQYGTELIFSTFIGGSDIDIGRDIKFDSFGNIIVIGDSWSSDFPTTANAYNKSFNGGENDNFVFKLNSNASLLIFSTYVGGNDWENCKSLLIDSDDNIYVGSQSLSSDYPTTPNAFDNTYNGDTPYFGDIVIFILNSNGSTLLFSTFIGGNNGENVKSMIFDTSSNIYLTGVTESLDFPTTYGCYDNSYNDNDDAYVLKLSNPCVPSPPQNLNIKYGNRYIILNWTTPLHDGGYAITGYNIYRSNTSDKLDFYKRIEKVLSFNDTSVINGKTYFYSISAVNEVGESQFSKTVNETPMGNPSPPLNLQAISGDRYVTLSWEPPIDDGGSNIINYKIYKNGIDFKIIESSLTNFNDTSVTNSEEYSYYITAKNIIGESIKSNEIKVIPLGISSPPQKFQANAGDSFIELRWEIPEDNGGTNIIQYKIYRGQTYGDEIIIKSVSGLSISYNDTSVINGQTYYYYITAVNNVGESNRSEELTAIPNEEKKDHNDYETNQTNNKRSSDNSFLIIGIITVIIVLIIMIIMLLKRKESKKQKLQSGQTSNLTQMSRPTPQQQYFQQQIPVQQFPQYKCELCNAMIIDPNKCPYCGWIRQF